MSKTLRLNAIASAKIISTGTDKTSEEFTMDFNQKCYFQFETFPDVLKDFVPTDATISVYMKAMEYSSGYGKYKASVYFGKCNTELNVENNIFPSVTNGAYWDVSESSSAYRQYLYTLPTRPSAVVGNYTVDDFATIAKNGLSLSLTSYTLNNGPFSVKTSNSDNKPQITLTYNEGSPVTYTDFPNGFANRNQPITFQWHTTYSGFPIEEIRQNSATLQWRNGSSGTTHSISISGSTPSYTMASGTLPSSGNIQWRVQVSTASGTVTSAWTTVNTADAIPVVTGVSPSSNYVDGTKEIRFTWSYETETGTVQTKYDLRYSKNVGSSWTTVKSAQTSDTFADIPANTFPSGNILWSVRGYNTDNAASEWSDPLQIIVISAPPAPQISFVNAAPRPTITWNAVGQQAYQVLTGSYDSGLVYGTEKTFKLPIFLPDGQTNFSVRVMNEYGYWSPYGTAMATIVNMPGDAITLSAEGGRETTLTWNGIENAAEYWVYRAGKRIAVTNDTSYIDRYAIGTNTYRIRAAMSDGVNYTDSGTATVINTVDHPIITTLSGVWLDLEYATVQTQQTVTTQSRDIYLMQFNGAAYPVPERGEFHRKTYTINTAFADPVYGRQMEDMLGEIVCVKNQYGDRIIGIFSSITKAQNEFWVSYSATVEEVDESEIG